MSTNSSSRGLRIALLHPCFWPEVRRGSERFIRELADGLIARGHHPRLITSHPGRPTRSEEDGLPVVRNWRPPLDARLQHREFEPHLTHVPFSYLSLRSGDDDIAHALYPTDALAAGRWSARTGRPSILSYMGIPDHAALADKRLRIPITVRAIAGSSAVVALSRTAAAAFERWLGVEARVIHPGVDLNAFSPGGERAAAPTIFCGAAMEEPRKGVDLLIRAFRQVRREVPEARLLLSRPRDPAVPARLGATDPGIELVDVDERSALVAAYRGAWVSALPSFGEAFGLVLVEALACGTPVVGSDRDAIPEVIDRDAIGGLFEWPDERSLARAIIQAFELAQDPGTVEACRERAADFSTDRCVEAYLGLYREVLGQSPVRGRSPAGYSPPG